MHIELIGLVVSSFMLFYLGGLSLLKKDKYSNPVRLQQRLAKLSDKNERDRVAITTSLLKQDHTAVPRLYPLNWSRAINWFQDIQQWIRHHSRKTQLEKQLPDVLDWIARALRAGHSLGIAITLAAEDATEPLGSELRMTVDALRYGRSMEDCLHLLAKRLPGTDFRFVVIAILVQRETGGNLAELLSKVANTLRARLLMKGFLQAQAAEGKLSAWILTLLPILFLSWTAWASPQALSIFISDPLGQRLMVGAGLALIMGTFWVWHLSRIRW